MICNLEVPLCPSCNSAVKVRDSRKRKIKDAYGNVYVFRLRRLQCVNCGQVHTEVPDFIEKFKHFSKTTIDNNINGKIENVVADNKTLYRWKKGK